MEKRIRETYKNPSSRPLTILSTQIERKRGLKEAFLHAGISLKTPSPLLYISCRALIHQKNCPVKPWF